MIGGTAPTCNAQGVCTFADNTVAVIQPYGIDAICTMTTILFGRQMNGQVATAVNFNANSVFQQDSLTFTCQDGQLTAAAVDVVPFINNVNDQTVIADVVSVTCT